LKLCLPSVSWTTKCVFVLRAEESRCISDGVSHFCRLLRVTPRV
jgi:hypothetical protein